MFEGDWLTPQYKIDFGKSLGSGTFGIVYKGYSKSKDCFVAIKKLKGKAIREWNRPNSSIQQQVQALKALNHPNIMRLFDVLLLPDGIFLVVEFCDGGDLGDLLVEAKKKQINPDRGPLSEAYVLEVFSQIVAGMAYVAEKGYMHRDIKPQNILICRDGTVKIADFGFARRIIGDNYQQLHKYSLEKGTPVYMAPNLMLQKEYSALCDVWSCGNLLYEMLTGSQPFFKHQNYYTLMKHYQRLQSGLQTIELPKGYHKFFEQSIKFMFIYDQKKRVTFKQINQHLTKYKYSILREMEMSVQKLQENQQVIAKPKKIRITAYATKKNAEQMPTADKITQLEIQQRQQHLIQELFQYCDFVHQRSWLFIELINIINTQKFPITENKKFAMLFLILGIFLATSDRLMQNLKQKEIKLPNQTVVKKSELNSKHISDINDYIQKLNNEKQWFMQHFFAKIIAKLRLSQLHPRISEVIIKMKTKNQIQSLQFFQENYRGFLHYECYIDIDNCQIESILRTYLQCVVLAEIKNAIPDKDFLDRDVINSLKQSFRTLKMDLVLVHIKSYKGQI